MRQQSSFGEHFVSRCFRRAIGGRALRFGAAVAALLASALAAPELHAAGNLRIGTYNTHFIGDPLGISDWATESEKDAAATEIAARINASDYDVLALNEVFDEDVRSIIHTQTRAKYPFQVVKVYGTTAIEEEDSGLMLLSRHPFVANPVQNLRNVVYPDGITRPEWEPRGNIYRNGSTSNMGTYVRFARFGSDCGGILGDCLADKGVGIVAVNVTMGTAVRRMAFLFTHLQATDGRAIRTKQFEHIQRLFGAMDYHTRFTKDDVFILGDLNIQGEDTRLSSEWVERFATDSGLSSWFANGGTAFRDSWYNEGFNSVDKGYTHTTRRERQRLDYILRNTGAKVRSTNLCDQHMGRAYNLQFGPGRSPRRPAGSAAASFRRRSPTAWRERTTSAITTASTWSSVR